MLKSLITSTRNGHCHVELGPVGLLHPPVLRSNGLGYFLLAHPSGAASRQLVRRSVIDHRHFSDAARH